MLSFSLASSTLPRPFERYKSSSEDPVFLLGVFWVLARYIAAMNKRAKTPKRISTPSHCISFLLRPIYLAGNKKSSI
jgi:hypothetical protein